MYYQSVCSVITTIIFQMNCIILALEKPSSFLDKLSEVDWADSQEYRTLGRDTRDSSPAPAFLISLYSLPLFLEMHKNVHQPNLTHDRNKQNEALRVWAHCMILTKQHWLCHELTCKMQCLNIAEEHIDVTAEGANL